MIHEPGDPDSIPHVAEFTHEQTDDELTDKELKQMEANDQVIQTILMGLLEDIYADVDRCDSAQEIWLRVEQMMKGSDIRDQEEKAKLFNEWEKFNYTHDGNDMSLLFIKQRICMRTHDPLALMADSHNPYNYLVFHPDHPSQITYMQHLSPDNNYVPQPTFNMNFMQQPMQNPDDITDPTTTMNMALIIGNHNGLTIVPGIANQNANQNRNGNVVLARAKGNDNDNNGNQIRCYNYRGLGHYARNCTFRPRRRDDVYLQTQLLIAQKEEAWIQLQAEEFDMMVVAGDIDEIEEVNANCILMANLQQASTSGTQTDKAPIYDSDGSAENDINVISEDTSMEHSGGTLEQHPTTIEKTRAYFESLYNSLAIKVEKVTTVNHKMKEEKHDPPAVYDSGETLQRAQESQIKMKQLNKEIKLENYAKINKLSEVSQTAKSSEEVYLSNTSKTVSVSNIISKSISISDDEFSNDSLSVAQKFLNEIKDTIVTLQYVVKHIMNANINNWPSPAHQDVHKIFKDGIAPIVNQDDASVQNFKNHFLKEAAKFVRDFKSLVNEADESLNRIKRLEKEHERFLRAVVSQDIIASPTLRGSNTRSGGLWSGGLDLKRLPNVTNKDVTNIAVTNELRVVAYGVVAWTQRGLSTVTNIAVTNEDVGSSKSGVIQIYLWCVDLGCSQHMIGNLKLLINFVWKFLGTVRFDNDHVASILGYGDLQYLEVAFKRNTYFIRNLKGVDLLKGNHTTNLYTINLYEMASASPICLMDHATSTKIPDISFLHVFEALCYPKYDRKDIGILGAKGDIGFFIGYSATYCAYRVYNRRSKKIMETMNVIFDELSAMAFEHRSLNPDVDELQQQHFQQQDNQSQLQPKAVANNGNNAVFDENMNVNPFAPPSTSLAVSSSQYVDSLNMYTIYQPYQNDYQWTKDHPLEHVIREPSQPVLTRNQLRIDGEMCIYALSLSTVELSNVKEVMTDPG
ncbi:retrovirus-related pol polyprotein from transposon TNT 1-94 [Tanacetum coccineum]